MENNLCNEGDCNLLIDLHRRLVLQKTKVRVGTGKSHLIRELKRAIARYKIAQSKKEGVS